MAVAKVEREELKKMVAEILSKKGCLNSNEISCLLKRQFNITASVASVGGILRSMAAKNIVGASNFGSGTVYWLLNKTEWRPWNNNSSWENITGRYDE